MASRQSATARLRDVLDVIVLGSGTPNPDKGRAGSAVAVVTNSSWLLVDCGRGATQRALDSGLDVTSLAAVFLTHHHSDHISDLATLAITRWCAGAVSPLLVIAPAGPAVEYTTVCLDVFPDQAFHGQAVPECGPRPTIHTISFPPTPSVKPVFQHDGWIVSSALVSHNPMEPAVGYTVERDDCRVTISGDTAVCDGIRELSRGSAVLVHETLLEAQVSASLLAWNAGACAVGALAAEVAPATLILTHLIPAPTSPADTAAFIAEVRSGGFAGHVELAHDGLRVAVG